MVDDSKFYFDELMGPKYLRYAYHKLLVLSTVK